MAGARPSSVQRKHSHTPQRGGGYVDSGRIPTPPSGTYISGAGTTARSTYWVSPGVLGTGPFILGAAATTAAIGAPATAALTDAFFYVNVGNTVEHRGIVVDSGFTSNHQPAIKVNSLSQGGGIVVAQGGSGPGVKVTRNGTSGTGIEVAITNGTSGASGFIVTCDAATTGPCISATHNGPGTALVVGGNGDYAAIISSATNASTVALSVRNHSASTAVVLDVVANGRGTGLNVTGGHVSAAAPLVNVTNAAGTQEAVTILQSSSGSAVSITANDDLTENASFRVANATRGESGLFERTSATATSAGVRSALLDAADAGAAIHGSTVGTGPAGLFSLDNSASESAALTVTSNAIVPAHLVESTGVGGAAFFRQTGDTLTPGSYVVRVENQATSGTAMRIENVDSANDSPTLHVSTVFALGTALRVDGTMRATYARLTGHSPQAGQAMFVQDTDGNLAPNWINHDPECLLSIHSGNPVSDGNIVLPPGNVAVQVGFDTQEACNDQVDKTTYPWRLSPTHTANGTMVLSGVDLVGSSLMIARVHGNLPGTWANAYVTLWLYKNGVPYERLDRRRFVTGETRFLLAGPIIDDWEDGDYYEIWMSQDGAAPQTITSWQGRSETMYARTPYCAACTG